MEQQTTKKQSKLRWALSLLLVGIVVALLFADGGHDDIINYPSYLLYSLWALVFVVVVAVRYKKFAQSYASYQTPNERLNYAAGIGFTALVMCGAGAGMLLTPLNIANRKMASHQLADSVHCPVDSAVIGQTTGNDRLPNTIYYRFNGEQNTIETPLNTAEIANIHQLHLASVCEIVAVVHKGWLGTYWLESWVLRPRLVRAPSK